MQCDNDSSMGHRVIYPQCFKGKVTKRVTIQYNEVESDTLDLCDDCTKNVAEDARHRRYKVRILKL